MSVTRRELYIVFDERDTGWYGIFGLESQALAFAEEIPCNGEYGKSYEHVYEVRYNNDVAYLDNYQSGRMPLINPILISFAEVPSDIESWYVGLYLSEKNNPDKIPDYE